jgi:hypothetical protein
MTAVALVGVVASAAAAALIWAIVTHPIGVARVLGGWQ